MSTSTDGILAYGYNLGGQEDEWRIEGVDEYGEWKPEWLDPEDEDPDLVDAVQTRLLASVGFEETDWKAAGYFERRRAAGQRVGVELVTYCSGDYPLYLLAAGKIQVSRGYVEQVNFEALERQLHEEDWDGKLKHALGALGITPKDQPAPRWLLVSYWG